MIKESSLPNMPPDTLDTPSLELPNLELPNLGLSGGPAINKPRVVSFGCRLNAYEGAVMRDLASSVADPSLVIINTCAVTAEAVRQAKQQIRKVKREDPNARIIVTGCAAQIDPESFGAMPEVSRVLGNIEKLDARNFRLDDGANTSLRVNDIMHVREVAAHLLDGFAERARAFVEVQQGCDHRCTFCIIPFGRGSSRSAPAGLVIERIQRLVEAGLQEIVLTGVDITSWGADLPGKPSLGNLVQRILRLVPDLPRLRLSSLDMIEMDPALFDALSEPRLMPHLHLSLQSGDDMILKRMRRRHSRDQAIAFIEAARMKRPDIVFGADLIAGFPTETEAMFANTLSIVEACDLIYLHVFPYSERAGTPAARMPQLPKSVRTTRAAQLRALGQARLSAYLRQQIGAFADVLIETPEGVGHSAHYASVRVEGAHTPGQIVRAQLYGLGADAVLQAKKVMPLTHASS